MSGSIKFTPSMITQLKDRLFVVREFNVILYLPAHNELSAYVLGECDNYLTAYSFKWLCIGAVLHLNMSMHLVGWLKAVRTTVGS